MLSYLFETYFLLFILGASIASFLCVVVERQENFKDFFSKNKLRDRSFCTNCKKKLNLFELIPVFSYIFLRGKCKTCKSKIPMSLFFGELLLGLWFVFSFVYFGNNISFNFIFSLIFGSLFFLIALEDLQRMSITGKYMYVFLSLGLIVSIVNFLNTGNIYEVFVPILIFSPYWAIYFLNNKYIGEADPYIFTAVGLFFGTQFSLSLFLYSVWFGSIYGIYYLVFVNKKFERNVPIPYLPIIFFSTLFILIFNYHIIKLSDILLVNEIL